MTRQNKNRLKGLLLLLVFSLNTVAGFACSIGVDMGYNSLHHQHDESPVVEKTAIRSDEHHHEHTSPSEHENKDQSDEQSENDCCTHGVKDFIKLDKSVRGFAQLQPPMFLIAFVSQFLLSPQKQSLFEASFYGCLQRSWRFTYDTDLRIVIQSFQI